MSGLPARFWAKVDKTETCWTWTAATNSRGYGCFGVAGKSQLTHRIAYEALVGPISDGLAIDHLCRNKRCCNPEHLEPVTAAENNRRASKVTTHCVNGHELPEKRSGRGTRVCRPCENARRRPFAGEAAPEGAPHGTTSTYNYYRCRCAPCKQANSDYQREYRNKRTAAAAGYEVVA